MGWSFALRNKRQEKHAALVAENPIVGETDGGDEDTPPSRLFPDRMAQRDFFVCDIFDAMPKSDLASMEHPIYSIQTRPDKQERVYRNGDVTVTVRPHPSLGLPTVHDKDILIYAISQVVAGVKAGRDVSRRVRLRAYDFLKATGRTTGGADYKKLRTSLERLRTTTITTNIETGGQAEESAFGLINEWRTVRESKTGKLIEMEIELGSWVFRAIQNKEFLTIDPAYFCLRSPLDRRLYELVRKHCGKQPQWECSLDKLREKVGARSELKHFRAAVKKTVEAGLREENIPGYELQLDRDRDMLLAKPRRTKRSPTVNAPPLSPDVIEEAKKRFPGADVYGLEADWKAWISENPAMRMPKRNADNQFLSFVESNLAGNMQSQKTLF